MRYPVQGSCRYLALVESFARGELAADWTNILSNPRADFRFYKRKIRGLARIGRTKSELDNADAAGERFHQDHELSKYVFQLQPPPAPSVVSAREVVFQEAGMHAEGLACARGSRCEESSS